MNNQIVKAFWKIAEDYPAADGTYIVAFPDRSGDYNLADCDVWEFNHGQWESLPDSRFLEEEMGLPTYYIDLPMPKQDWVYIVCK